MNSYAQLTSGYLPDESERSPPLLVQQTGKPESQANKQTSLFFTLTQVTNLKIAAQIHYGSFYRYWLDYTGEIRSGLWDLGKFMQYQVFVRSRPERKFIASIVGIPDSTVEGSTKEEAIAKAKDALKQQLASGELVTHYREV